MKKFFFLLFFTIILIHNKGFSQLPNGSTAPNWTLTDINGNTHTLYDYLDAGKTVYLDFFATWCTPCWNYHNTHSLEDLHTMYGPNGTDELMVFGIEGDASTSLDDLYGTGTNTVGDWVTGTPYPMIEGESITSSYQIGYWPTIYAICPDRKIVEIGTAPTATLYAHSQGCPAMGASITDIEVQNISCKDGSDGSISLTTEGWPGPFTYQWSNGATTKDISGLSAGTYSCTVTTSTGGLTGLSGAIVVSEPAAALTLELVEIEQPDCYTNNGVISVTSTGGEGPYTYEWSYGDSQESSSDLLSPGMYSVSVTDHLGCSVSIGELEITAPTLPIAEAGPNQTISCANNIAYLNAIGSSDGIDILYDWYTFDGEISTGSDELIAEVIAPGTYYISVFNSTTGCLVEDQVEVTGDISTPAIEVTDPDLINCLHASIDLSVNIPSTGNFDIEWTTDNGTILSGANTTSPEVTSGGTYAVLVTDTNNGCSSNASIEVESNTTVPIAQANSDGVLDCVSGLTELNADGSSEGEEYTYAWTSEGNIISTNMTFQASETGTYVLIVTNTISACTENAIITISEGIPPAVNAGEDAVLSCNTNSITLTGTVDGEADYAWSTENGNFVSEEDSLTPTIDTPGTYVLTAMSSDGCSAVSEVVISEDIEIPEVEIADPENLTCEVTSITLDGSSSSTGDNFSYEWTTTNGNILTGSTATNAVINAGGDYTLNVTNTTNGCQSSSDVIVLFESTLMASITQGDEILCQGDETTSLFVAYSGGTAPYTTTWSTGASQDTILNIGAGTYYSTVTDAEGCSMVSNYEVTEPTVIEITAEVTAQSAFGENDGSIDITVTGGMPPYSHLWSDSSTGEDISGLPPGEFSVIVTDANNCATNQTFTIGAFDCQIAAEATITNVSCDSANDGSISMTTTGGESPFTYEWSNGATTADISDLVAGDYQVSIIDNDACPFYATYTVGSPTAILVSIEITQPTCDGDCPIVNINPMGGVPPYNLSTPDNMDCLTAGTYSLVITDANDCSVESLFTIMAPVDINPPEIITLASVTVTLNSDGTSAPLSTDFVDNGSSDDCGIASMALSQTVFNCDQIGMQEVIFTVIDFSGNTQSTTVPVLVSDGFFGPSLTCPLDFEVTSCDHIVNYDLPIALDNCSLANESVIITEGLAPGEEFELGETLVSYMITDTGGNEATCSFNVLVMDANTMEVTLDGVTNETDSNGEGAIEVTINGGVQPFEYTWTSEDGVVISSEEDIYNLQTGDYTLIITDANGCQTAATTYTVDNLVGINQPQLKIGLDIMPNPTTDMIYGKLEQALNSDASIRIINILGQELITGYELKKGSTQFEIDLSSLTKGAYLLEIRTEKGILLKKVLVD